MKAIMILFDSLNRRYLPNYGCECGSLPNFERLGEKTLTFDSFYCGSMPCMPARRELHTGRYNFLHSSWSPMQPYDESVVRNLSENSIYTHIVTDHFHYWEDGGSGYLSRYDSSEMIRGQQGDAWKGEVKWPVSGDFKSGRTGTQNWRHDCINRKYIRTEEDMPQNHLFDAGVNFIETNAGEDNWFLQIESFDPHEPFYITSDHFKKQGKDASSEPDWPDYGINRYDSEVSRHMRGQYRELLSICDRNLGRILDLMDRHDLWKDTMLIVNTDHGFMLGEKNWFGKNIQPMYEELSHLPFFIYDPRHPEKKGRRKALAQTVDIAPTLAAYFQVQGPAFADGRNLEPVITDDRPVREAALFGIFGGHVNVTDGRYVCMRGTKTPGRSLLYDYTMMPCHMRGPFSIEELKSAEFSEPFAFTRGVRQYKVPAENADYLYAAGSMLFDLQNDPEETSPVENEAEEMRMLRLLQKMMRNNEAPREQFERMGIPYDGEIGTENAGGNDALRQRILRTVQNLSETDRRRTLFYFSACTEDEIQAVLQSMEQKSGCLRTVADAETVFEKQLSSDRWNRLKKKLFLYFPQQ